MDAEDEGEVCRIRDERGPRQPRPVIGAHEDPVDDERVAAERLGEADDDEGRGKRGAHGRVGGEEHGEQRVGREHQRAEHDAEPDPPPGHQGGRGPDAGDIPRSQRPAGEGLPGDGEGIEGESEEHPQRHRDLVGGQGRVTEAGGDPGRREEGGAQGEGTDEQRKTVAGGAQHPQRAGPQRYAAGPPHDDRHQRGGHPGLGEHRAEGRAGDAEPGGIHEGDVEDDVGAEPDDAGDERGAGVLEAPQDTGGGEDDEHAGQARGGDAQVGDGLVEGVGGGAEKPAEGPGQEGEEGAGEDAEDEREPGAVEAGGDGGGAGAGAEVAGDQGGAPVGEEDENACRCEQDRAGDAQSGEGGGAEVADDGGVGEQEERFGDEREERWNREPQHLPMEGVRALTAGHGPPFRQGRSCPVGALRVRGVSGLRGVRGRRGGPRGPRRTRAPSPGRFGRVAAAPTRSPCG